MSMGFIVEPHSFIYVTICMNKGSHAISLIVLPHTFIAGTIRPHLHSSAMFLSILSFAGINGAVGKCCWTRMSIDPIIFFKSFVRLHLSIIVNSHLALLWHIVNLEFASVLINISNSSGVIFTSSVSLLDSDLLLI